MAALTIIRRMTPGGGRRNPPDPQPCPRCRELDELRRQNGEQRQQLEALCRVNLECRTEMQRLRQELGALRDARVAPAGITSTDAVQRRFTAPSIAAIPLGGRSAAHPAHRTDAGSPVP